MQLLYVIAIGVYLVIGFVYSIYVILNRGGGVFSIPLNSLLGPIWIPIMYLNTKASLKRKEVVKKEDLLKEGIDPIIVNSIFDSSEESPEPQSK
jgi:hypothetical protein